MPADTSQHQLQFSFHLLFRLTFRYRAATLIFNFLSVLGFHFGLTEHGSPAQQKALTVIIYTSLNCQTQYNRLKIHR